MCIICSRVYFLLSVLVLAQENPCEGVSALFFLVILGRFWLFFAARGQFAASFAPVPVFGRHLSSFAFADLWKIHGYLRYLDFLGPDLALNSG